MYFPWVGMFEQIQLADICVYYDDVQFSKGSFTNRVQIKTDSPQGFNWMTIPLKNLKLGVNINEVEIDNQKNWQHQHLEQLKQAYKKAPYKTEIIDIVTHLFESNATTVAEVSKMSMALIVDYFNLSDSKEFYLSSQLNIQGNSSGRVCQIAKHFNATHYITGHGAKNYLDHALFEGNGIRVEYMDYLRSPYPQQCGDFNPHVSILDLIANVGKEGVHYIKSSTKYWKEFLA